MNTNERTLLLRSLDDDLSADEREALNDLLDASPEARDTLAEHRSVRRFVAEHGRGSFSDGFADTVMDALPAAQPAPSGSRADRPPVAPSSKSPTRTISRWHMGAALAAVVVLIAVGVALWLQPSTVTVPPGQTETVTLADGSTVELSAGSTLRYSSFWMQDERAVSLDGEAFFDIAHGERPFTVETFNSRVVVTGTRFNVRAWNDDPAPETAVTLADGRVHVAPLADTASAVTLTPGETAITAGDTTRTLASLALDQAMAWRSGGLAFVDRPLESVLYALEQRFGLTVRLADPALADRPLTYLNPQPTSGATVLSDICHTLGLRYQRTANGYVVRR